MKIIGLTGGIGSGKSTVLKYFENLGIPCYRADDRAKYLLHTSLQAEVKACFGAHFYSDGILDRKAMAALVFKDAEALKKLNALVHPAVALDFKNFVDAHSQAPFIIKEVAILFETGGHVSCDQVILVCAPKEDRIERVLKRDGGSRSDVLARMSHQWEDEQKIPLADFVVNNPNSCDLSPQLKQIYIKLKEFWRTED